MFPYLTCLHTTMFILLSGRDHCPGMRNAHFRFPSVPQKRRLLKLSIVETTGQRSLDGVRRR